MCLSFKSYRERREVTNHNIIQQVFMLINIGTCITAISLYGYKLPVYIFLCSLKDALGIFCRVGLTEQILIFFIFVVSQFEIFSSILFHSKVI